MRVIIRSFILLYINQSEIHEMRNMETKDRRRIKRVFASVNTYLVISPTLDKTHQSHPSKSNPLPSIPSTKPPTKPPSSPASQLRPPRHKLHSLPNPQIRKHLLRAPQNRIKFIRPLKHLHDTPHPPLRQSPPPKNIRRIIRNLMRDSRTIKFTQRNRAREELCLCRVG